MTKEEYIKYTDEAEKEYGLKMKNIRRDYAISNSPVKIGDIITDHWHTIKVDRISYYLSSSYEYPTCIYYGRRYTKKGQPTKRKEYSHVYQLNMNK